MAKIYAQNAKTVFDVPSTLTAAACTAGSCHCAGYAKLVGTFRSDVDSETGSGFRIEQGPNGTNWDKISASCLVTASAASSFSVDITGQYVRVLWKTGACAASAARGNFYLRAI